MNERLSHILKLVEDYLQAIYQDELDQVILFGSEARGNATVESDIDILIVLKHPFRYYDEVQKVSGFISNLCLEYDRLVSCCFTTSERWHSESSAFYRNIHREGIVL